MKKVLFFIGSTIYALVVSYILWLIFYLITPWIMSFGWIAVVIYWMLAGGFISGLIGGLSSVIFCPLIIMIEKCKSAKYLPAVIFLFFGYSVIAMPWRLDISYSAVKMVIACSLSITGAVNFITLIVFLFKKIRA